MKVLKVTGILVISVMLLATAFGFYIHITYPVSKPAPDIKIEGTSARVERGRYLAQHVAVCIDCHSTRDWSIFSGPVIPGTFGMGGDVFDKAKGFPGRIPVPNITPHALSSWTDGEILKAITSGVNKNGQALFPVMSYARFGKMDKEDIYSIIAYLRSLAPIKNNVPPSELDFPVSLINKTLPGEADFQKIPDQKDSVRYGAYLVNAAGCVDCHSKSKDGKITPGSEFGGGMEFPQPAGIVRAPNITFHMANGIGSWTKEAFVQRFKIYADSSYRPQQLKKEELNTPMPWTMFGGMSETDLGAIYAYLKSVKPIDNSVEVRSFRK